MKRFKIISCAIVLVALSALTIACGYQQKPAAQPPDTRAADENAIRAAVVEWDKAAAAKDLEKTLSFYAPDAMMFPPGMPMLTAAEKRREGWSQMMALPGYALNFSTTKVEVARSGDIAYETGTYEFTTNDKKGKPSTAKGKYVVVWKKQADGQWKAGADIWNADQ